MSAFTTCARGLPLASLLLAAAVLIAEAPVQAQSPAGRRQSGFSLIDDYYLEVEGATSAASIYSSVETRAILIVSSELPTPVLLWPRSRRVESLQMLKVSKSGNDSAEILPDPVIGVNAPFEVAGGTVSFEVDGVAAAIKPKPPIIGLLGVDGMVASSSVYAQRAAVYQPAADTVELLRQQSRSVEVRVFFGTWCPACGQMVPRIIRVAQELDGDPDIKVQFYGLPRGFVGEPEASRYGVKSVPTGVVLVDGSEIGRISGNQWRSPEKALSDLLGLS